MTATTSAAPLPPRDFVLHNNQQVWPPATPAKSAVAQQSRPALPASWRATAPAKSVGRHPIKVNQSLSHQSQLAAVLENLAVAAKSYLPGKVGRRLIKLACSSPGKAPQLLCWRPATSTAAAAPSEPRRIVYGSSPVNTPAVATMAVVPAGAPRDRLLWLIIHGSSLSGAPAAATMSAAPPPAAAPTAAPTATPTSAALPAPHGIV